MRERDFLLTSHFTDKANLETFIEVDKFNVRTFEAIKSIDCRKVYRSTIVKSAGDESVISHVSIYTFEKVQELDKIDGKDVLAIVEWKSLLTNSIVGYIIRL